MSTSTSTAVSIRPVTKQLTVEAPVERAFRVFTENMTAWWPKEHHIGKSPLVACVIEPRVDGKWYERCEDGSTTQWGRVLAWDPPRRLLLAWQLNFDFRFDPDLITEVEVRFTALGPRRTQVDFEHRNLERLGERAAQVGESLDRGWGQILDGYAATAADQAA
jgi:uncharacterized protein YndB with AHSA1/START domain